MLNHRMAAHFVGRGRAPDAEQLLAGVHDADVPVDDDAEREQPEQDAHRNGRQLEPVKRLHCRVLVHERAVVEIQPVLDQHVLRTGRFCRGRRGRRGRQLRGNGRRIQLLLEHAYLEFRGVHFIGDLVQLPCSDVKDVSHTEK